MILGKFKSVEDLSKAYEELQRHQGVCSEELGDLRKNSLAFKQAKENMELLENINKDLKIVFVRIRKNIMLQNTFKIRRLEKCMGKFLRSLVKIWIQKGL